MTVQIEDAIHIIIISNNMSAYLLLGTQLTTPIAFFLCP